MASLVYRITGDPSSFKAAMGEVSNSVDRSTAKMRALETSLGSIGNKLTLGVTVPAIALGGAMVRAAVDMDSLKRGLEAVSKTSESAETQLARLKEVAKLPGLGLREAAEGSTRLQAAGFSAQLAERSLKAFGNALATVGKGKAELDGVTLALSQIASKGKISAEEINQLAERVPQIRIAIKEAFGTADTEVLQKAGIGAEEFVAKVVAQLEKLKQVTNGPKNALENLSDTVFQSASRIGEKLLPAIEQTIPKLESMATGVADLVVGFTKLSPEIQNTVLTLGGIALAIGPVTTLVGKVLELRTALSFGAIGGVAASGLFGAVVIASISQTITAIDKLKARYKDLADEAARRKTGLEDLINPAEAEKQKKSIDLATVSTKDLLVTLGYASEAHKKTADATKEHGAAVETLNVHLKHNHRETLGMVLIKEKLKLLESDHAKAIHDTAAVMNQFGTVTLDQTSLALGAADAVNKWTLAMYGLANAPEIAIPAITLKDLPRATGISSLPSAVALPDNVSDKNIGPTGMMTKEQYEAMKDAAKSAGRESSRAMQQVSLVVNDLSREIAKSIIHWKGFGDAIKSVGVNLGESLLRSALQTQLTSIGKQVLKLTDNFGGLGKVIGKVFGSGASGPGGTIFSAASGGASSAVGAIGSGGSAALGAATSGIMGTIGAIGSVASAVSGIIGNFQFAGMNKTLDLIEKEVRYTQIHSLNILNKMNQYVPFLEMIHQRLMEIRLGGVAITGGAGGGGSVNVSLAGAYLLSDSQMDDFVDRLARLLKARGF